MCVSQRLSGLDGGQRMNYLWQPPWPILLRWIHYRGWPGNIRTVKENTTEAVEMVANKRNVCVCVRPTCSCPRAAVERWPCHGNNVLGITIWWNQATRVLSCPLEWQLVAAGTATQDLFNAHTLLPVFLQTFQAWNDAKQSVKRLLWEVWEKMRLRCDTWD